MAITDWTIVRRSLTARLFSTVTTVVMVAVSVGLLLLLLSMRDAGQRAFERGTGNMDLLISRDASPMEAVLNGVFYVNAPRNYLLWEEYERIADSQPFAFAIPTILGDSYRGRPVMATTPAFFTDFEPVNGRPWSIAQGKVFDGPWQVVAGAEVAQTHVLEIGQRLYLTHGAPGQQEGAHEHREYSYEVVGILAPTGSPHDRALFTDLTSAWVLHAHDRRLAEYEQARSNADGPLELTTEADLIPADRKITGIYARVAARPGARVSASLAPVANALRSEPGITVASPAAQVQRLFAIVSNVDRILLGMAAAVLVSSAISIMLALYNSMEQRRRQIAVLRVLGCSRGRIFGLIVTESAVLGALGALAGLAVAAAASAIVSRALAASLQLHVQPSLAAEWTLAVLIGTVLLAAAAGIVPAVAAYRTSVARNLRPLG